MGNNSSIDRIQKLDERIGQLEARKQQIENRMREKERKERTRRLIQVGAIFEKYFEITGEVEAEKIAYGLKDIVKKNKEKLLAIDLQELKK